MMNFKYHVVADSFEQLQIYIAWAKKTFGDTKETQYLTPDDHLRWSYDFESLKIFFDSDIELFVFSIRWGHDIQPS